MNREQAIKIILRFNGCESGFDAEDVAYLLGTQPYGGHTLLLEGDWADSLSDEILIAVAVYLQQQEKATKLLDTAMN